MLTANFLSPRYCQLRHDVLRPNRSSGTRGQWVLSRGLCYYRLFDLSAIPFSQREAALHLQIQQWSPLSHYASYVINKNHLFQVWIWEPQAVETAATEQNLKQWTVLPESVLIAPPEGDTVRLLKVLDGFEAQVWHNGLLTASHWWSVLPDENQWQTFQRRHRLEQRALPPITETSLLAKPWGRNRVHSVSAQLRQDSLWVWLGVIIIASVLTWEGLRIWQWQQAQQQLDEQITALFDQIEPIITARNQAIQQQQRVQQLATLRQFPTQIELMKELTDKIAQYTEKLLEWDYQANRLNVVLEVNNTDPRVYVNALESLAMMQAVTVENTRRPKQLLIRMELKPL